MESRVNYTVVGAFVLVVGAILLIIGLWLASGLSHQNYNTYMAYMDDSVSGLNANASVKYNGVDVGFVSKITLDKHDPSRVQLILKILPGTPISQDTRARLQTQGLTGMATVSLSGGDQDSVPLTKSPGEPYPVIKTLPSLMSQFKKSLGILTKNLTDVSESMNNLLNESNQMAIANTLENLEEITNTLAADDDKMDTILTNLAKASQQLPSVLTNIDNTTNQFSTMAKEVSSATVQIDQTMRAGEVMIQGISDQAMPEAVTALGDLQELLANMQQLNQTITQNPAVLIKGKQQPKPGPGE